MANRLIEYFQKISLLTKEEQVALETSMLIKNFKKGEYIMKQGAPDKNSYFVMEGCVRAFRILDGEEWTQQFYTANDWIISLNSFSNDKNASSSLICVESSEVVIGDESKAQAIFKKFPRFETISRTVMERVFAAQKEWLESYQRDSPEYRYLKLLEQKPEIFQKVPQYQIASYIGVKPESLSRIRQRMRSGEKKGTIDSKPKTKSLSKVTKR
jgi:CRP-like cAMP-binding protein